MKSLIQTFLAALAILAIVSSASAATTSGTTTYTERSLGNLTIIDIDWLSESATSTVVKGDIPISGRISQIVFYPDQADATSPTANYDVTLLDDLGVDVMQALGADRSQADSEIIIPRVSFDFTDTISKAEQVVVDIGATSSSVNAASGITTNTLTYPVVVTTVTRAVDEPVYCWSDCTLYVTAAGAAKGGAIRLYVVRP